jgi:GT2 family glycosyltransferase
VDNGSTDESRAVARSFDFVTCLDEPKPGSYAARNRGLAAASGDYVAFTDSDCEAHPDWLANGLEQAARHVNLGVLAGHIEVVFENDRANSPASIYERLFAFDQKRNVDLGYAVTANWLSPKELLLSAGGFNAKLKSGGDSQLSQQLRKKGHQLIYASNVLVSHPARSSARDLFAKKRRVVGGDWSKSRRSFPMRFAWLQGAQLLEAWTRITRIFQHSSIDRGQQLRAMSFLLAIWAVGVVELIWLFLGAEPQRR